jgi:hypothetical protein
MIARSSSVPEECMGGVAADPKITQRPELIDANIRKAQ